MVSYLDSLGATIDGEAAMSPPQEALKDIKQGVLATHMKSTKEMRHLVESSVSLVMPASSVVTGLRSQQGLDRVQLQTDMAYMLAQRALSFARCMIRFGWGDSSPIGAYDFLLWKFRYIMASDLADTHSAMVSLITTKGGSLGASDEDGDEISLVTVRARENANAVLKRNVREHICAPATQGQGRTSAEDKVASVLHIHNNESYDCGVCVGPGHGSQID